MAAHTIKTSVAQVERMVLSTREAMAYLDCSADKLEELRREREIEYYKHKSSVWYDLKSINQFLRRCRQQC
jgi:hypothetical protein